MTPRGQDEQEPVIFGELLRREASVKQALREPDCALLVRGHVSVSGQRVSISGAAACAKARAYRIQQRYGPDGIRSFRNVGNDPGEPPQPPIKSPMAEQTLAVIVSVTTLTSGPARRRRFAIRT